MTKKSIRIHTFGCKLNFSESATLEQMLRERGYHISQQDADIHIINTCAVTKTAEKKCQSCISAIRNKNPFAQVALVGCYATLDQIKGIANTVDLVFSSANKLEIADRIDELGRKENPRIIANNPDDPVSFFSSYSLHERTRSYLKVQDGCDYHCTYCTVARARGKSRSDSIENILNNVRLIASHDVKEIVLTGVNIGDFRTAKGETLYDLLLALQTISEIKRIRISSIEPNLLTDKIIDLVADSQQLLPHFHIPLQSGCDAILGKMKRRYNTALFAQKVEYIKKKMPHACIAADVIAAFPSESDENFQETYQFIGGLPISMLHVFPYSPRPNTPAAEMLEIISPKKKDRCDQLLTLSKVKQRLFYQANQGKELPVLIEECIKGNYLSGFTDNYIRVKLPYDKSIINQILNIRLEKIDKNGEYYGARSREPQK